jgi:hypothetical protein
LREYFQVFWAVWDEVVRNGEPKKIAEWTRDLPPLEEALLREAIKLPKLPLDVGEEWAYSLRELGPQMVDLYTDFVLRCGGKAKKWEVLNPPPAPSRRGTNYLAEDPARCVDCIMHESWNATDRLWKLVGGNPANLFWKLIGVNPAPFPAVRKSGTRNNAPVGQRVSDPLR